VVRYLTTNGNSTRYSYKSPFALSEVSPALAWQGVDQEAVLTMCALFLERYRRVKRTFARGSYLRACLISVISSRRREIFLVSNSWSYRFLTSLRSVRNDKNGLLGHPLRLFNKLVLLTHPRERLICRVVRKNQTKQSIF
jgi:hypothetical protein